MTVAYLDHAAASDPGRRYKSDALDALDLRPGLTVLDVGCGPGTDLPALAAAVAPGLDPRSPRAAATPAVTDPNLPAVVPGAGRSGRMADEAGAHLSAEAPGAWRGGGGSPGGRVIGVDVDAAMVEEARRRWAAQAVAGVEVKVVVGDVHALPLPEGSVDRARADRVLQHVADPGLAVAEMRRVVRPGGRVVIAEPDWDTLVIADPDAATSRAYTRFVSERVVRNATVGRELARLLDRAGFATVEVRASAVLFTQHAAAERILRMSDVARRGWEAGALDEGAARAWLGRLAEGPFVASFTLFTVVAG